ncbi:MAG: hypothetical protein EBS93_09115 [Chitinophagia bacterium]|nr:hypothetical protein [Chitinophagia bacterium]
MAKGFNLTAQINLVGPTNLKPIVADIKRELGSVDTSVQIKLDGRSSKSITTVTKRLQVLNDILVTAKNSTDSLNASLASLSSSLSTIGGSSGKVSVSMKNTASSTSEVAKNIKQATTEMEEFGKQSALAIRRFAAFSVVSTAIYGFINAINSGFKSFIAFDKELVKLQQVTGKGATGISFLEKTITSLSTQLGVSSDSLLTVASTLAQAGLSAEETRIALTALAKTELAPSFDNLTDTTEGAIAALRQFELQASELEGALGSINAVAAAFAVESKDIISAIQRTGGVFAAASKGVSEGTDALNEFIAIFTSVRQTTRESAETIATGLRTIFTRIQRGSTIEQLKNFGIELTDLEGKFVGPFEAVRRLSEGLKSLDPRDLRFSQIVEELGGFRQIGKVIPLIQQFTVAQEALKIAQKGQGSLTEAQIIAQKSLANQVAKVREQFLALIRDVGKSSVFQGLFKLVTGLTSGLISLASAFKPILPILGIIGTIKGVKAIGEFGTGFFGGLKKGGGAKEVGTSVGSSISGAKEKEANDVRAKATTAITENTNALKTLTTAVNSLTSAINSRGPSTLKDGGKILGFNKGGMVPGNGGGDTVPAFLEGGEIVINRKAVQKYGASNLLGINRYAKGGISKAVVSRVIDGDTLNVDITPKPDPFNTSATRLFGFDAYELNKGSDEEKKLGLKAKILAEQYYPQGKDVTNIFTKKHLANTKRDKYGRYFYDDNEFGKKLIDQGLGVPYTGSGPRATKGIEKKYAGGIIQKFMAGSPKGINVPSGKGRGQKTKKGARAPAEIPSVESFVKWAKGIYDEYDADPSLVMATDQSGMRAPPEILLANKILSQIAFETGGAGMSLGQRFVRTPKELITPELQQFLIPDPTDSNET